MDFSFIKQGILQCVSKRKEIMAAYVFGSVATGRVRPGSDVDVAVLLDSRVRLSQMLNYRLKLMAELRSHLI